MVVREPTRSFQRFALSRNSRVVSNEPDRHSASVARLVQKFEGKFLTLTTQEDFKSEFEFKKNPLCSCSCIFEQAEPNTGLKAKAKNNEKGSF